MVATNTRCQGLLLLPGETGWGGIDTFPRWVLAGRINLVCMPRQDVAIWI